MIMWTDAFCLCVTKTEFYIPKKPLQKWPLEAKYFPQQEKCFVVVGGTRLVCIVGEIAIWTKGD